MSVSILGKGWVTNHGCDEDTVFAAISQNKPPRISETVNPFTGRIHHTALVAKEYCAAAESFRRVRRSSTITLLALTAAQRAIQDSGIEWTDAIARRTTLLFVSSDGGVAYTRRFYADVVKSGSSAASPILFPETVYNAPASHLCAFFGMDGDAVTLVGDAGTVGGAMHYASGILATDAADYCLVVGAEELDWILCEAYFTWGQTQDSRSPRNKSGRPGACFAEGAGALLLGRKGPSLQCATHPGFTFQNLRQAEKPFQETCDALVSGAPLHAIVSSANGTQIDTVEASCFDRDFPGVPVHRIKKTLGEALAASIVQQVIYAAMLLRRGSAPGKGILVSTLGFSDQGGAMLLTLSPRKG